MYQSKHYENSKAILSFQPIDLCRELSFSLGNAIKYIIRAPYKANLTADYNKAIDYLRDYSNAHYFFARGNDFSPNFKLALEAYCKKNEIIRTLFNDPFQKDNRLKTAVYQDTAKDHEHFAKSYLFCCDAPSIYITKESVQSAINLIQHRIKAYERLEKEFNTLHKEFSKLQKMADDAYEEQFNDDKNDDENDDE